MGLFDLLWWNFEFHQIENEGTFTKKHIQMANKRKICATLLTIWKMLIKTTVRYHCMHIWVAERKKYWQHQLLARMQRHWISHTLTVRIENGTAILQNSLSVSYKTEYEIIIWTSNSISSYIPKRIGNLHPHKILYRNVHSSVIQNNQSVKTPQMVTK